MEYTVIIIDNQYIGLIYITYTHTHTYIYIYIYIYHLPKFKILSSTKSAPVSWFAETIYH